MVGYPKSLKTKEDYEYVRNNFPKEMWKKDFQALLDSSYDWFFVEKLLKIEEIVLAKKRNLDPVVDSKLVDVKEFNSALVEKLANSKQYDVILVDTAGRKDLVAGNFDPRKLAATDVPHITSAYTSNAIIIPMKPTGLDMIAATNYYLPLIQFHQALLVKKVKKYNTVVKIVPSMVEKDGGGVKELNIFKDETQFEFFSVNIRRSEKIANTVNSLGIETLFTTNVASNVLNSFYQLCEECFSEIDASIW